MSAVKGVACPGGELVYNCTVHSSNTPEFDLRWKAPFRILTEVIYLYDINTTHGIKTLGDFTTTVSSIPPDYTLTSTATLRGAQFSHNNYVLECLTFQAFITLNKTIVIEGIAK